MKTLILCFVIIGCSTPAPSPKTVETDLCAARAAYKAVAAAAGGKLDPAPGSARAKLEAAEDALCATLTK